VRGGLRAVVSGGSCLFGARVSPPALLRRDCSGGREPSFCRRGDDPHGGRGVRPGGRVPPDRGLLVLHEGQSDIERPDVEDERDGDVEEAQQDHQLADFVDATKVHRLSRHSDTVTNKHTKCKKIKKINKAELYLLYPTGKHFQFKIYRLLIA